MQVDIEVVQTLLSGGVAVIPTDTIYGVVALAANQKAVERVYSLKKRAPDKPCIILISNPNQMLYFGVDKKWLEKTAKYWPGPNSLIVPTLGEGFDYLTRDTSSLAFRLPDKSDLISLIEKTGPLIAPSANPESLPPATNTTQAKKYFGNLVDIYIDGGDYSGALPSKLIDLATGQILR